MSLPLPLTEDEEIYRIWMARWAPSFSPFAGIVLPPREGRIDNQGNLYWEYTDEMRRRDGLLPSPSKPRSTKNIQGFTDAMFEYGIVAAADPFNIVEAFGWAASLGVSWRLGYLFAIARGVVVGAPILAIVDPLHKWEGGLDETAIYQRVEANLRNPQGGPFGEWPAYSLG